MLKTPPLAELNTEDVVNFQHAIHLWLLPTFSWRRNSADLDHKAQGVKRAPALHDLAALMRSVTVQVCAISLLGFGDPEKLPFVNVPKSSARGTLLPFGDHIIFSPFH